MEKAKLFKVSFINQDKIYDVFAKQVYESDLYGFIVIEELIFGSQSDVVIDASEEKLKAEFESVRRTFVPLHNIIRIDEVEKEGVSKIHDLDSAASNVMSFPGGNGKGKGSV